MADNTGTKPPSVSNISADPSLCLSNQRSNQSPIRELRQCIREFRYVWLMKRSGFGHHPGGEEAAKPGELAVKCPACPYPDINLPSTWRDVAPNKR